MVVGVTPTHGSRPEQRGQQQRACGSTERRRAVRQLVQVRHMFANEWRRRARLGASG